jgi:hypothetical protein
MPGASLKKSVLPEGVLDPMIDSIGVQHQSTRQSVPSFSIGAKEVVGRNRTMTSPRLLLGNHWCPAPGSYNPPNAMGQQPTKQSMPSYSFGSSNKQSFITHRPFCAISGEQNGTPNSLGALGTQHLSHRPTISSYSFSKSKRF